MVSTHASLFNAETECSFTIVSQVTYLDLVYCALTITTINSTDAAASNFYLAYAGGARVLFPLLVVGSFSCFSISTTRFTESRFKCFNLCKDTRQVTEWQDWEQGDLHPKLISCKLGDREEGYWLIHLSTILFHQYAAVLNLLILKLIGHKFKTAAYW